MFAELHVRLSLPEEKKPQLLEIEKRSRMFLIGQVHRAFNPNGLSKRVLGGLLAAHRRDIKYVYAMKSPNPVLPASDTSPRAEGEKFHTELADLHNLMIDEAKTPAKRQQLYDGLRQNFIVINNNALQLHLGEETYARYAVLFQSIQQVRSKAPRKNERRH